MISGGKHNKKIQYEPKSKGERGGRRNGEGEQTIPTLREVRAVRNQQKNHKTAMRRKKYIDKYPYLRKKTLKMRLKKKSL